LKFIAGSLAILVLAASLVHAQSPLDAEAQAFLQQHGPVKLAPDPSFAPVEFIDARGRHRGLSADLTAMLVERTGITLQIVRKDRFADVLPALAAGEIDVASSVFSSAGRAERFLFSKPYLRLPAALIVRRDGPVITQLADLRGRAIAVVDGHVWQELLTTAGYAAELRAHEDIGAALTAVAEGKADAYAGDLLSADPVMRRANLGDVLAVSGETQLEAEVAYAIRRDLPQLKLILDQALATISVEEETALRARWEGDAALVEPESVAQVPPGLKNELTEMRRRLEASTEPSETERLALLKRIDVAMAFDAAADEHLARAERIGRDAEQARAEIAAAGTAAASTTAEDMLRWRGSLPQRATLNQLEQLLATEQSARGSQREALDRLSLQAQELQQRPSMLRREIIDLRSRLDALTPSEAAVDQSAQVERLVTLAEMRSLRAALSAALSEQAHLDDMLRGIDIRKRERQRLLAQRGERVTILEQLIAERSDFQLSQELEGLRGVAAAHAEALPAIRDLAADNLASGEALAQHTSRLTQLREQAQIVERDASSVGAALQNAKARIAIGGVTDSVGRLLLAERRRLPNLRELRSRLTALQREAADTQLLQISLAEEIEGLRDLGAAVARLTGSDGESETILKPELRAVMTELLLARSELLPRQLQVQRRSLEVLQQTEEDLAQLLVDSQALSQLMAQNLLWIPSHRPTGAGWLQRSLDAWRELLDADRWRSSAQRVATRLPQQPMWILGLMIPLALLLLRPRLLRRVKDLAIRVRDVRQDSLRHTLDAVFLSAVIALPMATFCAVLAHILQSSGEAGRFTHSLGVALQSVVLYGYMFALLSVLCRDDGVAHAHLRWLRARRGALLRLRPWLYFGVMPLAFLAALTLTRDIDAANSTVLRSVLIALSLLLAAILGWLLAPGRLFASRVSGVDPLPTLRRLLRVGLMGALLAMAVIALAGYVYTVATLLRVFLDTLQVLLLVALVHGLALRWLVIGERRVAMALQAPVVGVERDAAGMDVPQISIDSVNLRTISEQSRSLLRALTVISMGAGLLWSLAEVAPALSLLDRVVLWQTVEMVDGVAQTGGITLGDVLLALIALLVGIIAARNIPGLLEILLLRRFTEDASVRYAVVAVTRYLITFAMVVAVFGLIGVRWGHLQWLAAGFSVGLGFGLQEIFGNFVAGLILLFERPFRVGDVVTIGELSGTVRRVQTRATTIADWDGKDIIIPNKTFITERFVNWTLSDTVTRITLTIGVAYDSDPEAVRAELLDLARAHPAVLDAPAPVALFMALGDSALNFELRCFVREIGDRLRTIDDLHSKIINRFRERGIEISYPQMDVHLHRPPLKATPVAGAVVAAPGN
jgi:potassium efflux system protein